MSDSIFVLNSDGNLYEMKESQFLKEDDFQQLLAKYPNLLSGDQINREDPRRWLMITREMGIPDELNKSNRWSLDHLLLDQEGIPTLVEVKRSSDTRLRREVIGQILDYAANAVTYWSIEDIIHQFQNNCEAEGKNADEVLENFLSGEPPETFWERVKTNLIAGKIRMLIVADVISKELLRIIEFLNGQMVNAELLGVELKQFLNANNQLKTLVPRVVGQTTQAILQKQVKHISANQWEEISFFEEIKKRHPENFDTFKSIYDFSSKSFDKIWWGKGSTTGSFIPGLELGETNFLQFFGVYTYGTVEIQFQWFKKNKPFDDPEKRLLILEELNSIFDLNLSKSSIDLRPGIRIEKFKQPGRLEAFFALTRKIIEDYRKSN